MVAESKSSPRSASPEAAENDSHSLCSAVSKNGEACGGRANESGFCFAHDPSLNSIRETARVRGGENSSRAVRLEKLMPRRLRPLFDRLEQAMQELHEGKLDPRRATAMASLAGAMVKVLEAGELEELTRKLHELQD